MVSYVMSESWFLGDLAAVADAWYAIPDLCKKGEVSKS